MADQKRFPLCSNPRCTHISTPTTRYCAPCFARMNGQDTRASADTDHYPYKDVTVSAAPQVLMALRRWASVVRVVPKNR